MIIPALNEADNLAELLPILKRSGFGDVIVCDNGSTDATAQVVQDSGARWVFEEKRGYGAACYAGMEQLPVETEVVAFIDADLSDDPAKLAEIVKPILAGHADFVLGARAASLRASGSMTFPQQVANRLFPFLIRLGWGHVYEDLAPLRAIRRSALDAIEMRDRAYGWTIEMQIRAVELGLRIREVPVAYRRRHGRSKISGTVRGVILAAYWITRTCGGLWFTKRRRARQGSAVTP